MLLEPAAGSERHEDPQIRSVHLGGRVPGAVPPPSNLGTGRPIATATGVATVAGVGESGEEAQRCRISANGIGPQAAVTGGVPV